MKDKLTKLEIKWIMYDIGNSAFILLVSTILPIYFNSLSSAAGIAESDYLSYWSYATSISTLIVALTGPILGTFADYKSILIKCIIRGFITCMFLDSRILAYIPYIICCSQSSVFIIFNLL